MKVTREELLDKISKNQIHEVLESGVELKATWNQDVGKDISAIANKIDRSGGWVVIGCSDKGFVNQTNGLEWLTQVEQKASNHINQFLNPDFTVVNIRGENISGQHVLIIEVTSPNEVVRWNDKAYKLVGTVSSEMSADEILSLSLMLPGSDFSKMEYQGPIDESLVIDFGKKIEKTKKLDEDFEVKNLTAGTILSKLHIANKNAAGILFGSFKVRTVHYKDNEDILDQKEKHGLYNILRDDFIDEVQSWTRTQATQIQGTSLTVTEEQPYPIKALREILANAVAHAMYSKDSGGILVEIYPKRIVISNHCDKGAKFFTNKWFSKAHKTTNNLLMECLKLAGISDELGSGKRRVFRTMIEAGKREPIVEFQNYGHYSTWSATLYNEESNVGIKNLYERLVEVYNSDDERRLVQAFVLWKDKRWSEIEDSLDAHYREVAKQIRNSKNPPIFVYEDKIYLKRWIRVSLDGAVTKKFTESEEAELKAFLSYAAFLNNRQGYMTSEEIRQLVGVQDSHSETTQISRLLSKWADESFVEKVVKKRGEWKFLQAPAPAKE
ncbi:MAG: RNA-binding domain-containing protein [Bacteriovoracaceae bacterium]